MKRIRPGAVRAAGLIAMICLCAMAVLYVGGAFEFSFISRRPLVTNKPDVPPSPPVTTRPFESGSTPPDSNTTPPQSDTAGGSETQSPETAPPTTEPSVTTPSESGPQNPPFSPPTAQEMQNKGYYITYDKYNSNMVIVSVPLTNAPTSLFFGKKAYREATKEYLYSDETFAHGTMSMTTADRYSVETYMEYILVAGDKGMVSLYDSYGRLLLIQQDLAPAYTRDRQDRPLFFINAKKEEYYYFDIGTGLLLLSDYNDFLDGRGVYFNYNPLYGKSDNGIYAMSKEVKYTKTYNINMSASYEKFNIGPEIARDLWEMYPNFATKVARYNMRFSVALTAAKKEIAAEKAEAAKTTDSETTLSPDETLSPDGTTGADTTTPVEPSVSETLASPNPIADPEQTTAPDTAVPNTSASPDTTVSGETGTVTDTATGTDTSTGTGEGETTAGETTSPYPSDKVEGKVSFTKEFFGYRFGFGKSEEKITLEFAYGHTYNFREGRAAIVRDDGTLFFVNKSYRRTADLDSSYSKKIEGTDSAVWYYAHYYQPLYRDIRGFGHLYYDSGYVMVRKAETEKMRNKRVGDDLNILLDLNGKQVAVPSGYTLVTCTEGIMVLERLGRYGYYDIAKQEWIVSPVYTSATPFYEGMGVLCDQDGKYGAIDAKGNVIIPFEFDYLSMMSNGLISAYVKDAGWQVFAKMTK